MSTATVLFAYAYVGHTAVNPITVTYDSGSTSFILGNSGTANYVVSVNPGVIPANAPLTFHLTSARSSANLSATQTISGASPCTNVTTLCGSSFSLSAGQSCCLAFSLTSSQAGNYSLQPSISTTPSAYPAQAPSATPIVVTSVPATIYTGIYALTATPLTTYSIDNGATWLPMLNQPGIAVGNDGNAGGTFFAVDSSGTMYITTGTSGAGALFYSSDGIIWTPMNTQLPNNDTAASVFALNNTIYVGTGGGYVYSTTSNGTSWIPLASPSNLDGTAVTALFSNSSGTIYAGTNGVFGTSGGRVYFTVNNGSNWSQVGMDEPDGGEIWSLTVDTTGTVYASTSNSGVFNGSLPYITNYAGSWDSIGTLSSPGNGGLWSVSALGSTVYVGAGKGTIFYSTNPTSGSAAWTQTSHQPLGDGSPITSLLVNQSTTLSPLFVEESGVVPVGGGSTSVTVKNLSNETVTNVHAQLPSSLNGVTQQESSDCASVIPQGTCTLTFTSSKAYIPQNIAIVGSNTMNPIERIALVFSIDNYLVYNVNTSTGMAYVVDNSDTGSAAAWGTYGDDIPGITENDTQTSSVCNGATDGTCDTQQIVTKYVGFNYAANGCYNKTTDNTGNVSRGTWYLPSTCELNGGLYLNSTSNTYMSCSSPTLGSPSFPVTTGIFSLYSLGLLSGIIPGYFWSSTEDSDNPQDGAWLQFFASGGGGSQGNDAKDDVFGVRCSRALPL